MSILWQFLKQSFKSSSKIGKVFQIFKCFFLDVFPAQLCSPTPPVEGRPEVIPLFTPASHSFAPAFPAVDDFSFSFCFFLPLPLLETQSKGCAPRSWSPSKLPVLVAVRPEISHPPLFLLSLPFFSPFAQQLLFFFPWKVALFLHSGCQHPACKLSFHLPTHSF